MAYTDRELLKLQQTGALGGNSSVSNAVGAIAKHHSRTLNLAKFGTENAATAVAESVAGVVTNKGRLQTLKILTKTTIANNNTDHVLLTFSKRTSAGASQTTLGTWNTATAAQGAITANVPASVTVVANSDAVIDAGSVLTYTISKAGAGQLVDNPTVFVYEIEEV